MTNVSMDNRSIHELLDGYRQLARRHATAKRTSAANAAATELLQIAAELKRRGPSVHALLMGLFEDEDDSVRLWAASHTLEVDAERATSVLHALAAGAPGGVRASAAMTLREWRAGRLKIP